jgi:hypothetical protein
MPMLLPQNYNPFLWNRGGSPFGGENNAPPQQKMRPKSPFDYAPLPEEPQDPMLGKYRDFLGEGLPSREEHKPNFLDKLRSIGDPRALDRKYNRALEDRNIRGSELAAGAKLEYEMGKEKHDRGIEERRTTAYEKSADSLAGSRSSMAENRARRTDLAERIADGKATDEEKHEYQMLQIEARGGNQLDNTAAQGRNQIGAARERGAQDRQTEGVRQGGRLDLEDKRQSGRQKIAEYKTANPTFRIVAGKGGNYFAINPADPTDVQDTGVATGTLTDEDKAELGLVDTKTVTTLNSEGTQRTTDTTRTRKPVTTRPDSSPRTTPNNDESATRRVGTEKTFPNGRKGRWDGKGWVAIP